MNTRELRIGNYVEIEGLITKIVSIGGKKDNHVEIKTLHNHIIETKMNALAPVPLTNDFLFKCCEFDKEGKHTIGIDHHRHYLKIQDGYIVLMNEKNEILIQFWDVKYLHQLQNLYFALKGKEMAIILD